MFVTGAPPMRGGAGMPRRVIVSLAPVFGVTVTGAG
jgi:hypothetical protein